MSNDARRPDASSAAELRVLREAGLALRAQRPELARTALRRLLAAPGGSGMGRLVAAQMQFLAGDAPAAIAEMEASSRVDGPLRPLVVLTLAEHEILLGRDAEAAAHLETVPDGPPALHERLAELLSRHESHARALPHFRRAWSEPSAPARLGLAAARCAIEAGAMEDARAFLDQVAARHGERAEALVEAGEFACSIGDLALARGLLAKASALSPAAPAAALWLGRLDLWSGDVESAAACAHRLAQVDAAGAASLAAACHVAAHRWPSAVRSAELVLAHRASDVEARLVLVEAALRGEPAPTIDQLSRHVEELSRAREDAPQVWLAASLLLHLDTLRLHHLQPSPAGDADPRVAARADLHDTIALLGADAERRLAEGSVVEVAELIAEVLDRMHGNRGPTPTIEAGGIRPIRRPLQPRPASRKALSSIAVDPAEHVLRRFDALIERHAGSAQPLCYRGELLLWLGRYEEAMESFQRALGIARTRWAYIGLGAALACLGRLEASVEAQDDGFVAMGRTSGPSLFIYRGEALRRLGRVDRALEDLTTCTEQSPRRVSGWVNLALLHDDRRDAARADACMVEAARLAPGLLMDAREALGSTGARLGFSSDREAARATMERCLAMMRGNRSSVTVTYFTQEGVMRGVSSAYHDRLRERGSALDRILAMLDRASRGAAR